MEVIIIEGIPIPWKAPFVGKRGSFNPQYNNIQILREIVRTQYQGEPLEGPLRVNLIFYMPIPKSISKKKQQLMEIGKIFPTGRPDRTNLAKLYEDLLNGIVIGDDSQIVCGTIDKRYGHLPRTIISIKNVEMDEN
jgi:Holliday junction resolvase RusA-like endonuclease